MWPPVRGIQVLFARVLVRLKSRAGNLAACPSNVGETVTEAQRSGDLQPRHETHPLAVTSEHTHQEGHANMTAAQASSRFPIPAAEQAWRWGTAVGWRVASSALIAAIALTWLQHYRPPDGDPWPKLLEASAETGRHLESRLTGGFPWTPLRHSSGDRPPLKMSAVASEILRVSTKSSSREHLHAAAVAQLLANRVSGAVSSLEKLAAPGNDARACSDLAAARYALAVRDREPLQLARALAASDCALRLDATLPEALFNRALIVEQLGLRDNARAAWEAYLTVDATSDWAHEARQHIRELQPELFFPDELGCMYEDLMSDPAPVRVLARKHPQDARFAGETEILAAWATAEQRKHPSASGHLGIAREIGAELALVSGDTMLRDLVAAIDRADAKARHALVEAHLAYGEARDTYRRLKQPARARPLFLKAEEEFLRGGSPGARLARYFAANVLHPLGRAEQSRETLEKLAADCPPQYIDHRAQVLWQIGLVHYSQARWGNAIDALNESVRLFDALQARGYAASIREILANAHDRIGDRTTAWHQRMLALREFGRYPSSRLLTTLMHVTQSAIKEDDFATGTSLLGLVLDVSQQIDDRPVQVAMHLQRARLHLRMHQPDEARADLTDARAGMLDIIDPGYQSLFRTNAIMIEAALSHDPRTAVELLTRAIEFHQSEGLRAYLPELWLERGRVHRRMNAIERAAADFEAGVAELESTRETLTRKEDRFGIFRDREDLFEAAIDLALDRRLPLEALAYAERARARALFDALGVDWRPTAPRDVPDGTVIFEYFLTDDSMTTFALDSRGVRVVRREVNTRNLLASAAEITSAARTSDRAALRRAGRSLYRELIEPIEADLPVNGTLVVIPDANLAGLPFVALIDEAGRYLIERTAIVVSPSAAVYAQLARRKPISGPRRLLLVRGGTDNLDPLAAAERELRSIATSYSSVERLESKAATATAFARAAASADVIHFVGHAVASTSSGGGYLVLQGRGTDDDRLDLKEIAALRLQHTSLVSLAACSTASGDTSAREGTASVGRAFLAAGARSVISTLWPIDDAEAATFFPAVHRHLSQGLTPAEAVRTTQLEWIRNPDARTSLWTGVQVIGN